MKMALSLILISFVLMSSVGMSTEQIRCYQNPQLVLGDFPLSSVEIQVLPDKAVLTAVTQGKEDQWDQVHQGLAAKELAKLSPAVAAYITDVTHFYRVSAEMDLKTSPTACGLLTDTVFAADCFENKSPVPAVTIQDLVDTSKPPFQYQPSDFVMFETYEDDMHEVSDTTRWQGVRIGIDNAQINDQFLLLSDCKVQ